MKTVIAMASLLTSLVLVGCNPGQSGGGGSSGFQVSGFAEPLSDSEFNSLSAEQQYAVVNKVLATIYKGMPVDEFFDLSAGLNSPQARDANTLRSIRTALRTELDSGTRDQIDAQIVGFDSEGNENEDLAKYFFDGDRPRSLPLARIHEYPLSRDGFINWMAYFLGNTIMFSPALEMESTEMVNVQNTFRRLAVGMQNGRTIRQIIASHLPTEDRWRVSRSAENHALEAYELYLGLFDTEEDSQEGGIACKDLYLTDEDDGYQLVQDNFPNTTPQYILNDLFEIVDCNDFHSVIAGHPRLLPRVTEVIINYLMDGRTITDRLDMVQSIVNSGAETFEDVFTAILFSREYLLNTERPRSFEETVMHTLSVTKWDARFNSGLADERIFDRMVSDTGSEIYLGAMGWDSMALKIGRTPFVPMDALSFANYHKGLRENIMLNENSFEGRDNVTVDVENPDTGDIESQSIIVEGLLRGNDGQGDIGMLPDVNALTPQEYIDFLFLTADGRRATTVEMTDLIELFDNGVDWLADLDNDGDLDVRNGRHDDIAAQVFDYLSRLPGFYYVKNVN